LAVRRVTQDNHGRKTAGVDGVKALTPSARLQLADNLKLNQKASPTRRVWIPKPGKDEKRPLAIPTIQNRAEQALVKLALEPEWEARFEANSYGFRPGRSVHDAIEAIFNATCHKEKYVLDADIAQCFDRIDHTALLNKLQTFPSLRRTIRTWLKAGVIDEGYLFPTEQGAPQGGPISPLIMNIALHGLETHITAQFPKAQVVRYADDLIALHPDLTGITQIQQAMSKWLAQIGLELKPSKTRITHTLDQHKGNIGFDFLGFHIRQHKTGKTHTSKSTGRNPKSLGFKTIIQPSKEALKRHHERLKEIIQSNITTSQARLIGQLNPIIKGWTNYYATVSSSKVFSKMAHQTFTLLVKWVKRRHPTKPWKWIARKYWHPEQGKWQFAPPNQKPLHAHYQTLIKRHIKVKGIKSPYDSDWLYWARRLGKQPGLPKRTTLLLKRQSGKCALCELYFKTQDNLEIDHIIPKSEGGWDGYNNWQLLHAHCHHKKSAQEDKIRRARSTYDKGHSIEEPGVVSISSTVLKPSGGVTPSLRLIIPSQCLA
jgi:RNA-directed DNA polymerase